MAHAGAVLLTHRHRRHLPIQVLGKKLLDPVA